MAQIEKGENSFFLLPGLSDRKESSNFWIKNHIRKASYDLPQLNNIKNQIIYTHLLLDLHRTQGNC